jgi:hypothetical protein
VTPSPSIKQTCLRPVAYVERWATRVTDQALTNTLERRAKISARALRPDRGGAARWAKNHFSAPDVVRHYVIDIPALLCGPPWGRRDAVVCEGRIARFCRGFGTTSAIACREVLSFRHMSRKRQPYGF